MSGCSRSQSYQSCESRLGKEASSMTKLLVLKDIRVKWLGPCIPVKMEEFKPLLGEEERSNICERREERRCFLIDRCICIYAMCRAYSLRLSHVSTPNIAFLASFSSLASDNPAINICIAVLRNTRGPSQILTDCTHPTLTSCG